MANIFDMGSTLDLANRALDYSASTHNTPAAPVGFWANVAAKLEDPNVIRALGEVGQLGGEGSVGNILGNAGSNLARRQALQNAAAKQVNRQQSLQEKLIQALSSGKLLSPMSDNQAFDSATITGDGDINLKLKNTPQPIGFAREQIPLEAQRRQRTASRGLDLPNFFKASLD